MTASTSIDRFAVPLLPLAMFLALSCNAAASKSNAQAADALRASADDTSLVAAAGRAYDAEIDALRAYAREECQECPGEARYFLAGARYAFEKATLLHPQDPKAFLGLANVLYSSAFVGEGVPDDSLLDDAEKAAARAVQTAENDSLRATAESLLSRIRAAH